MQNLPFLTKDTKQAPLADIDDGFNDLIIQERRVGRCQFANYLLKMDKGDYFTNTGRLNPSLGLEYYKVKEWKLEPIDVLKKKPVNVETENMKSLMGEDRPPSFNEKGYGFFSIDGEKYQCSTIYGEVLREALNVFCL